MVILIGGVSCCGKTLTAQRLVKEYAFGCLSLDHLKMGLIRGMPGCPFSATDGDDSIAEKLWPIIRGIIMTAIENNQNLIIEGCYLPPEELMRLPDNYREHIAAAYIIFSREYIARHFEDGVIAHACDIETRGEEGRSAEWFAGEHERLKSRCAQAGAAFFEITYDYGSGINSLCEYIDAEIRNKLTSLFMP